MKRVFKLAVLATALVPMYLATAQAEHLESLEINKPAAAVGFTQDIDASKWSSFSAQAVYSNGTPAVHNIADGTKSTATLTVGTSPALFISTRARVNILVSSPTTMSGDSITLNGIKFTEGTDFTLNATTATMVAALTAKIDAHPDFVATFSASTITVYYATIGESGNGLAVSASDSNTLRPSASTFTGGVNQYTITINDVVLKEGVDFNAGPSLSSGTTISSMTAVAIRTAINSNATLAAQVYASTAAAGAIPGRRIDITALKSGNLGYSISASTTGFATTGFSPGSDPEFDIDTDIFTKSGHGLTTGLKVLFSTGTSTTMSMLGLSNGTTYYAIKVNEDKYALATTSTTAVAGTKIDISSNTGSGATFRMTPNPLTTAAGNGFYWSFSNDGVNYSTYTTAGTNVSSVTYSAAGSQVWDFGTFNYRYLRCNFTPPSAGGIALSIRIYGKKD